MPLDPDQLVLSRHARRAGRGSYFYRAVERGEFVRLAQGVYLPMSVWRALDADDRQLARVHAILRSDPAAVIGYLSAACVWHLPQVAGWPSRVDVVRDTPRGGPYPFARPHVDVIPERLDVVDGIVVTSLERTLVDVAATRPMSTAVAMIDFALSDRAGEATGLSDFPTSKERLFDELGSRSPRRGRRAAETAIAFADGRSGSPGESVSRTAIHVLGAPVPDLQVEFVDAEGSMFTDFWWERPRVFGEFDGLGKYLKPEFMRPGESAAGAVIREKRREDRIRATALHPTSARWDWPVAWNLVGLERILRGAGLTW